MRYRRRTMLCESVGLEVREVVVPDGVLVAPSRLVPELLELVG